MLSLSTGLFTKGHAVSEMRWGMCEMIVAGAEAGPRGPAHLWGVVLAGGGGVRLRALTQRICGDDRPKQYVPVFGARTLLRQTLDRVALGIPLLRTAVVTLRSHAPYFAHQWAGSEPPHVLVQPADREIGRAHV